MAGRTLRVYRSLGLPLILTVVGGAVGLVTTRRSADVPGDGVDVTTLADFAIWSTLVAAETALAVFLAATFTPTVWGVVRRLWRAGAARRALAASPIFVAAIVAFIAFKVPDHVGFGSLEDVKSPVADADLRFRVVALLACLCGLVFVIGVLAVRALLTESLIPSAPRAQVVELLRVRRELQGFGAALTAIVAGGALCTGAWRNMLLSARSTTAEEFPIAYVLLYGGFFTALVAFVYLPVHLRWHDRARELRDRMLPLPADGLPTAAWMTDRQNLEKLLGMDTGVLGSLRPMVGVFAPFLGSLVAVLIPATKAG